MNQKFLAAKEFVSNHKTAITVVVTAGVTATAVFAFHRSCVKDWNAFLAIKDLTDEFYPIES